MHAASKWLAPSRLSFSFKVAAIGIMIACSSFTFAHGQAPPSLTSSASNNFNYSAYNNSTPSTGSGNSYNGIGNSDGGFTNTLVNSPGASGSNITNWTNFSAGNVGITVGSNCSNCNSTTQSFSNGNGTYNTITTYSSSGSNMSSSNSSASSGSNGTSSGCIPVGAAIPVNAAVPAYCTGNGSGTGGGTNTPTASQSPVTSIPIANCTSGGKGSTPVCGPSSCRLSNGQTLANGQSTSLFTTPSGQCVLQTYTCANGALTGGVGYQSCSNTAATPAAAVISAISITALPTIVRYGGSSMITWNGGTASSCSVSGPYFSAGGVSGSKLATNIPEERTYTLNCIFGGTGGAASVSKSASVTVKIVPLWREF